MIGLAACAMALSIAAAQAGGAAGPADAGAAQPDGGADERDFTVQRGAQVGGSRRAATPPLRDIVPVPEKPGHVIHEVKPVPRPHRSGRDEEPARDR